jgi:uncharacterized protein YbjQ (UPF0145 family)
MSFENELIAKHGVANTLDLMKYLEIEFRGNSYWWKGNAFDNYESALRAADASSRVIPKIDMLFTTTPTVAGREIEKAIGMVSADCAYGMNVFRDMFAGLRDLVGGRSQSVEKILKDAKKTVQTEMAQQALDLGADAIVSVDFDFNELDGGGKNGMLLVSGTGTAVKLTD